MSAEGKFKISVDTHIESASHLQAEPVSSDVQADAMQNIAAAVYDVGAALAERLEYIGQRLGSISMGIHKRG